MLFVATGGKKIVAGNLNPGSWLESTGSKKGKEGEEEGEEGRAGEGRGIWAKEQGEEFQAERG